MSQRPDVPQNSLSVLLLQTPLSCVLLQELQFLQLVPKFTAFYGIHRFSNAFTTSSLTEHPKDIW